MIIFAIYLHVYAVLDHYYDFRINDVRSIAFLAVRIFNLWKNQNINKTVHRVKFQKGIYTRNSHTQALKWLLLRSFC